MKFDLLYTTFLVAGVISSAVAGALRAVDVKMDIAGTILLAFLAANSGGTIRDLLLGVRVFWMANSFYIVLPCFVGGIVVAAYHYRKSILLDERLKQMLIWADAMGLAIFSVIGVEKSLVLGQNFLVSVFMGLITAVGGGIVSDIASNRTPVVFSSELYISTSLLGGIGYVLFVTYLDPDYASVLSLLLMLLFRAVFLLRQQSLTSKAFPDSL